MKKQITNRYKCAFGVLFLTLGLCTPVFAQQEAKTLFVNMPDTLSLLLTKVNREDCIDFLESKMKAKVENRFGNESEMTDLSTDFIRMQMSSGSTWQMKLFPVSDSTQVICTVSTVCAPVCDSNIRFYTTDWKELPNVRFMGSLPVMDDFFAKPDSNSVYDFNAARLQADMLLMKADLSKEAGTLTFTLTTPDYMEKEMAEKLQPFLRRSIIYVWKNGRFDKL